MTIVLKENRARFPLSALDRHEGTGERMRGPWHGWFLLVMAAAYLLFCHGCHADKDAELRLRVQSKSRRILARAPLTDDHFGLGTSIAKGCGKKATF